MDAWWTTTPGAAAGAATGGAGAGYDAAATAEPGGAAAAGTEAEAGHWWQPEQGSDDSWEHWQPTTQAAPANTGNPAGEDNGGQQGSGYYNNGGQQGAANYGNGWPQGAGNSHWYGGGSWSPQWPGSGGGHWD